MNSERDILIVGGGVIGLCTAYYAMRQGHRVTLVERDGPDHDCCSMGNAGMIVPSHFVPLAAPGMVSMGLRMMWNRRSPFYIKPRLDRELASWCWQFMRAATEARVARAAPLLRDLHLSSRRAFVELSGTPGFTFDLAQKGLLVLCRTEHGLEEERRAAARARQLHVPADILTSADAAKLDPGIRMDVLGAVYYPNDCHLTPNRFMADLTSQLERGGARFHWKAPVTAWRENSDGIAGVETPQGALTADHYVIAGGAWSGGLGKMLGWRLPLQAGKGYSITLPQPKRLPSLCSILAEARVAVTPMGSALRFGGTMEIAGLDESIAAERVQGIIESATAYLPEFRAEDFEGQPVWRGLRPCSPDGLPYVGRSPRHSNLWVATGHAMMGLSLGPATGRLMAQLLSGAAPEFDIALLDPGRYDGV